MITRLINLIVHKQEYINKRVYNLHSSSVDGVFHEWRSSWSPRGTNKLFLCKGARYYGLCKNMADSVYGVPFVSKFITGGHIENTGDLQK